MPSQQFSVPRLVFEGLHGPSNTDWRRNDGAQEADAEAAVVSPGTPGVRGRVRWNPSTGGQIDRSRRGRWRSARTPASLGQQGASFPVATRIVFAIGPRRSRRWHRRRRPVLRPCPEAVGHTLMVSRPTSLLRRAVSAAVCGRSAGYAMTRLGTSCTRPSPGLLDIPGLDHRPQA